MSNAIQRNIFNPFLILPFTVLTIGPGLHDVNGFPKLVAVVIGTFILVLVYPANLKITSKVAIIPWMIVLSYGILQLISLNDLNSFLLGAYMRNGGYITLICLATVFTIVSNLPTNKVEEFKNIFLISIYGLILYAVLQFFELLPYRTVLTYQGSLTLTLTNPNFTSAYLGIAISGVFILLIYRKRNFVQHILLLPALFYFLFETQSLQGFLIVFINFGIYLIYERKKIFLLIKKFKKSTFLVSSGIILLFTSNLSFIGDWLTANGSIKQRLSYWGLSIEIWRDHFLTGVGLDNLRNFTTSYRSLELVKQEGMFTAPDRSHNVILDHFVNGGLFTGLLWLIFVVIVSRLALKNIILAEHTQASPSLLFVGVCWFGYLLQSLISVDHLALTVLGFIAGGFIIAFSTEAKKQQNLNLIASRNWRKVVLGLTFTLFLIFSLFSVKIFEYERNAYKFLIGNDGNALKSVYNSKYVVAQTLEDVAVKVSQAKEFENAYYLALKLLSHDPTSHQAYYMRAVYYESKNNLIQAKKDMLKALEIDQFNSVYLLGMAVLEYNLGNSTIAREYLKNTIIVNPNQTGIDIVTNLITKKAQ
jgi:tetratricopeptide (TPR) repeat protein